MHTGARKLTSFRWSPAVIRKILRWAVNIGGTLPLIFLIVDYFTNNLTANPIQALTQRTGRTALILLVIMLACTPANLIFNTTYFTPLRKPLGLFAFGYAFLHFIVFSVLDYGLDISGILAQFSQKPYLLLGLAGLIILTLMAITSFRWWMKKLGKGWKRLHQLVYPASLLIVLHYGLAQKGNLFGLSGNELWPLVAGGVVVLLLMLRIPAVRRTVRELRRRRNVGKINDEMKP